jgi:pilus assembly protein CpaE
MSKEIISIQILGSSQSKLTYYRSQISSQINKEITTLLYDGVIKEALYKDKTPPTLLIFLLDNITIEALGQLTALPSSIRPALLVIAQDNNKENMRLSMQAGARDFFTDPANKEELVKSLNQILFDLRRGRSRQGILTTIINAKGGSGGSFITSNLAHIASVASDSNVVLMDFDLQFGAQSLNLDLKPQHTIVEAINDVTQLDYDALDGYMVHHKSGLKLLTTLHEQLVLPGEVSIDHLDKLLTLTISSYDLIFIDLPRQIDSVSATILERSDKVIIVVQQSLAHLRDARRLVKILKSEFNISNKNIIIVVNRYDANAHMQLKDIQNTLEIPEILTIPNDYEKVAQSTNLGIPLYDYAQNAPITKAIIALAEALNVNLKKEFKSKKNFLKKMFHLA